MITMTNFSSLRDHPLISNHKSLSHRPPSTSPDDGLPILAIAILGISAGAFLVVIYYIFITKCHSLHLFSCSRPNICDNVYSTSQQGRGINELIIQEIPTFKYISSGQESSSLLKCGVCLNEFQENDVLRLLPKDCQAFHEDCIDVWLQSNSNLPLCRSTKTEVPNSSPQYLQPVVGSIASGDCAIIEVNGEDELIKLQEKNFSSRELDQSRSHSSRIFEQRITMFKERKLHHLSFMGDEGIDVRRKDGKFSVLPIRRSLSMGSAINARVWEIVQEITLGNTPWSDHMQ